VNTSILKPDDFQTIILVHEHFLPSEVLLGNITFQFNELVKSKNDSDIDFKLFRVVNFLKNWIKFDFLKFRNSFRDLGINNYSLTLNFINKVCYNFHF
jgi:hypothetical protein